MTALPVRVGDVVRIVRRYGPLDRHVIHQCPTCRRIISVQGGRCRRCGTRFEEVTPGFVEVVALGGG